MRYFYDFEFLERGPRFPLVPISVGVVSEDTVDNVCWAISYALGC